MEQTKNAKKVLACLAVSAVMACSLGLAACSSGGSSSSSSSSAAASSSSAAASSSSESESAAAATPDEAAGFTELQIENAEGEAFEDVDAGDFSVSAVYFQPVPMGGASEYSTEGYDLHLEADVTANQNNGLGIEYGLWVPYMTVDYTVTDQDSGAVAAEGTFMEMSATDGPHYGANIALPNAGTYDVTFTFHSPADNGYLLHTDAETGDGLTFDAWEDGPIEVTFEGWAYTPQEW